MTAPTRLRRLLDLRLRCWDVYENRARVAALALARSRGEACWEFTYALRQAAMAEHFHQRWERLREPIDEVRGEVRA